MMRKETRPKQFLINYQYTSIFIILHFTTLGKNPTIPDDKFLPGRLNISESIFTFIDSNSTNENARIFLTTDNQQVYDEAQRRYGSRLLYVPGEITHIDRSSNTDQKVCREQTKLMTDFHLLGDLCDTSIISNSGFGFWGNLRRFRPFENLFVFCSGRIYKIESMWHLYKMREQNHFGASC